MIIHISIFVSTYLSIYLPIYLSSYLSIYLYIYMERERESWIIDTYFCVSSRLPTGLFGHVKYCLISLSSFPYFPILLVGQPSFAMPRRASTCIALTVHISLPVCSMQIMMVLKGKEVTCLILMQVS